MEWERDFEHCSLVVKLSAWFELTPLLAQIIELSGYTMEDGMEGIRSVICCNKPCLKFVYVCYVCHLSQENDMTFARLQLRSIEKREKYVVYPGKTFNTDNLQSWLHQWITMQDCSSSVGIPAGEGPHCKHALIAQATPSLGFPMGFVEFLSDQLDLQLGRSSTLKWIWWDIPLGYTLG